MKALTWLLILALVCLTYSIDPKCGEKAQIECQDDINIAYPICKKAAEEKGKDYPVDITCLKYFAQMTEECWACICWVASFQKWKIIGCD